MKYKFCFLIISVLFSMNNVIRAQEKNIPTLTTDDVMNWKALHPDQAQPYIPREKINQPKRESVAQSDARFMVREKDWNARLAEAQAQVKAFERRANRSDLAATESRNQIFLADGNAANSRNVRVAELQETARNFRIEARHAQALVNRLLDEGRESGFQIFSFSPTLKNGEPNLDYYRAKFQELQSELLDLMAEKDVLRNEANRYNTVVNSTLNGGIYYPPTGSGILFYPNNGAGDLHYLNRLRENFAGTSGDLKSVQTRIEFLFQQIEELKEAGRKSGVPPGIFR